MKRQSMKTPIVISGIFFISLIGALTAVFGQFFIPGIDFADFNKLSLKQVQPLKGHWLRTGEDTWYKPASLEMEQSKPKQPVIYQNSPVFTLEQAKTALNKTSNTINVMYLWSDNDQLKVISITSFNKATTQAAIVVVPLHTVIDNTDRVNLNSSYSTIQDLYKAKGREGVRQFLEKKLEINLPNFVQVNQSALQKISDIIGILKVNGDNITMLEAFEQTAAGLRTDDRDVVRAVASQVLRPGLILEIPNMLYIFTHDIRTNFTTQEMVEIFYFSRQMDLKNMRKAALPGYEFAAPAKKYLFVSGQAWKNIIYDITQANIL